MTSTLMPPGSRWAKVEYRKSDVSDEASFLVTYPKAGSRRAAVSGQAVYMVASGWLVSRYRAASCCNSTKSTMARLFSKGNGNGGLTNRPITRPAATANTLMLRQKGPIVDHAAL